MWLRQKEGEGYSGTPEFKKLEDADAPDIDGLVFIENNPNVKPGDFVDVKVTDSSDYDLFAEVVKEP